MHTLCKLIKMEIESIEDDRLCGHQYVKKDNEIYKIRTSVTFNQLQNDYKNGVYVKDMYLTDKLPKINFETQKAISNEELKELRITSGAWQFEGCKNEEKK